MCWGGWVSRWVGGHEWVGGWVGGEQVGEEGWFGVRHLHAPQAHHSPRIPLASPGWGLLTPPIPPTLGLLRVGNRSPEMASESATTSPLLRSFSTGSCPPPACTSLRVSECCLRVRVSVGGWGHEQRQLPPPPPAPACVGVRVLVWLDGGGVWKATAALKPPLTTRTHGQPSPPHPLHTHTQTHTHTSTHTHHWGLASRAT